MDQLDWLKEEQIEEIMNINRKFARTQEKPQVVLALVKTSSEDFDQYVAEVFSAWKIGQVDSDNGVLLLFARNQGRHNVRIEVGYGLEDVLTDQLAGQLLSEQKKQLKSNNTEDVTASLLEIVTEITGLLQVENDPDNLSQLSTSHPLVKRAVLEQASSLCVVFWQVAKIMLLVDAILILVICLIAALFSSGGPDSNNHFSSSSSFSSDGSYSGGGGSSGGGGASI